MIAYLDSSVVLRVVLGEPDRLKSWPRITRAFTSELCRVECNRVLDRLRLAHALDDDEVAERREAVEEVLAHVETAALDRRILKRAAQPLPTTLGTLDAIHVVTAVAIRARHPTLRMASHDVAMRTAARALGLRPLD